jgi:hypothetical protein
MGFFDTELDHFEMMMLSNIVAAKHREVVGQADEGNPGTLMEVTNNHHKVHHSVTLVPPQTAKLFVRNALVHLRQLAMAIPTPSLGD